MHSEYTKLLKCLQIALDSSDGLGVSIITRKLESMGYELLIDNDSNTLRVIKPKGE